MPPALYLHIGINKTGTSAIQYYCNTHHKELLDGGLLYPVLGCNGDAHYGISRALGFSHGHPSLDKQALDAFARQLDKEFDKSRAESCLISSEDFVMSKDVHPIRDFFSSFDCRIVVYLRRHDHWWESAYAQAVKMKVSPRWEPGIKSFINFNATRNPKYGNYRLLVDRWAEVFGKEKIIVRPYEGVQNPGGITADILRTIGFPQLAERATLNNARVNESLSASALHVIDLLQRAEMLPDVRDALIKNAMRDHWAQDEFPMLPPRFRRRLIKQNQADYEYIAREYMGRADGILFTEAIPDIDDPWEEPVTPQMTEVVSRLVNYLAPGSSGQVDTNTRNGEPRGSREGSPLRDRLANWLKDLG